MITGFQSNTDKFEYNCILNTCIIFSSSKNYRELEFYNE